MQESEHEQSLQHNVEHGTHTPYRRIGLDFGTSAIGDSEEGRRLNDYVRIFNGLSGDLVEGESIHYKTIDDVLRHKDHLDRLFQYRQLINHITSPNKIGQSEENEAKLNEQVAAIPQPDLPEVPVSIENQTDLAIYSERFKDIRHALLNEYTAIETPFGYASNPTMQVMMGDRLADMIERRLESFKKTVVWGPEAFTNAFKAEPTELEALFNLLKDQTAEIKEAIKLQVPQEDSSIKVGSSINWGNVFMGDVIQNILRKRKDKGITDPTDVVVSFTETPEGYDIVIADDGGDFPPEIVKHGFKKDVGENQDGEHRAMARHSEIAEMMGGKLSAANKTINGKSYAEVHLLLPRAA